MMAPPTTVATMAAVVPAMALPCDPDDLSRRDRPVRLRITNRNSCRARIFDIRSGNIGGQFGNPAQRWNHSAHFGHFFGSSDLYALNDMTITSTPVPEVGSLVLILAGMTGLGCFGFFCLR